MHLSSQHFEPAEIGEEGKERHEWRRDLGGTITDRRPDCLEPNVTAPVARCASHPPRRAERPVRSRRRLPMLLDGRAPPKVRHKPIAAVRASGSAGGRDRASG